MKAKLAKLIELKTIITLLLILTVVVVVLYLTFTGQFTISAEFFGSIVTAIITYYFLRKETAAKSTTLESNIAEAQKPPDETIASSR